MPTQPTKAEVVAGVQRLFDEFTGGGIDDLSFIHPECRWEENELMGFPGLDPVYVGPDGVRKWIADVREVWGRLESIVEDVDVFERAVVVHTRLSARGRHDISADMRLFNVFWERDGLTARRRIYLEHAAACAAAQTPEEQLAAT